MQGNSKTKPFSKSRIIAVIIVLLMIGGIVFYSGALKGSSTVTSTTATSVQQPSVNQTLVVDYTAGPDNLDPASTFEIASFGALQNIMDPLVYFNNSDSSHFVPILAENYTVSANGNDVDFMIRKGITFSSGDALNAYCIWYSFYRANVMAGNGAYQYTINLDLSGVTAKDLNQFNSSENMPPAALLPVITNSSHAIWVPNPYEVRFHFQSSFPDKFGWLAGDMIVDPVAITMHGGVVQGQPNTWANLNPIGTGRFMLQSWVQGTFMVLTANPNYWGGPGGGVFPKPQLSKVEIRFVPSSNTREHDIISGDVGVAVIDTPRVAAVNGTSGVVFPDFGISNTYEWMPIDVKQYPLNITKVRQAVVHAINVDQVNQIVYHGLVYPTAGVVPYGMVGFNASMKPYSYDPALASKLLEEAGFPNGTGVPALSFYYATDIPETYLIAQIVQANLAAVGIKVQLKGLTEGEIIGVDTSTSLGSPNYPSLQFISLTSSPQPSIYANPIFTTGNYANMGGYSDPIVDNLLAEAGNTLNDTLRVQLYLQASNIVYNSYGFIFIGNMKNFFPAQFFAFRTNVHGYYYQSSFSDLDFSTIYLS